MRVSVHPFTASGLASAPARPGRQPPASRIRAASLLLWRAPGNGCPAPGDGLCFARGRPFPRLVAWRGTIVSSRAVLVRRARRAHRDWRPLMSESAEDAVEEYLSAAALHLQPVVSELEWSVELGVVLIRTLEIHVIEFVDGFVINDDLEPGRVGPPPVRASTPPSSSARSGRSRRRHGSRKRRSRAEHVAVATDRIYAPRASRDDVVRASDTASSRSRRAGTSTHSAATSTVPWASAATAGGCSERRQDLKAVCAPPRCTGREGQSATPRRKGLRPRAPR
jgi:hypothetical protein